LTGVEGCEALANINFDGKTAAAPAAIEPSRTLRRVIMLYSFVLCPQHAYRLIFLLA
jgi:hypothetical protein